MKRIRGMIMQQVLRKELPGLHDRLSQGEQQEAWSSLPLALPACILREEECL